MQTLSCGMWDLGSLTRDQTRAPCIGRVKSHKCTYFIPMLQMRKLKLRE